MTDEPKPYFQSIKGKVTVDAFSEKLKLNDSSEVGKVYEGTMDYVTLHGEKKLSERMKRMGDVVSSNHYAKEVEALEAEVKRLTDLNSGLSEQAQGMDYCAEESEKKVKKLNEELKDCKVQCRINNDHRAMYCKMKNDAEDRLAKAQSWKDNQLERLKDFYDTVREYEGSQEYYWLKELEEALK